MAFAKKDTFWNKQRVEKGLTLKEISELVGEKEKKVSAYFSGFLMPRESTIRTLCDLFDVDFHTGNLEFQHAHKQYKAERDLSLKYRSTQKGKKKNTPSSITSDEDILDALYGVLPRKEFLDIYKALYIAVDDSVDYRRILYNAVDYDTYCKINQVIEESRIVF